MHVQVRSISTFVAEQLYGKIPRRRVLLLAEKLAEKLLQKLLNGEMSWSSIDPLAHRVFVLSCDKFKCDPLIGVAAHETGLKVDEILQHLPRSFVLPIIVINVCNVYNFCVI